MKNSGLILGMIALTSVLGACNSKSNNAKEQGMPKGGGLQVYSRAMGGAERPKPTGELAALIKEVVPKFKQFTFIDTEGNDTIPYNMLIPEGIKSDEKLPLVLFMADGSTPGDDVTLPLTQGYGGLVWGTNEFQSQNPCFVVVPQYPYVTVDDEWQTTPQVDGTIRLVKELAKKYQIDTDRIYTTGQSMGGMMSLYFNIKYPDFFAASLFVACQWDLAKMGNFKNYKFVYVAAQDDQGGHGGQLGLEKLLKKENAKYAEATWSARLPENQQDSLAAKLLNEGCERNFITFEGNTVLTEAESEEPLRPAEVHMASFNYAYRLAPVRDWLFRQHK